MNLLSKEKCFNYSLDELLGIMRFDFYDGEIANKWNPRTLINKLNEKDKKELQKELNYIQFKIIKNFDNVIKICEGKEEEKQVLVYIDLDISKYVIKLIPLRYESSYIYVYRKEK